MSRVSRERQDSESCSRALSQARMYLEQIRSRVAPGGPDVHGAGKRDYLVDAAKQIRLALERDVSEDYEEAFNHYKNGVDVLLSGVQVDPNKERHEAVKRKITQYLKRAEEIFNCHLQRTLGNGSSTATGYSSLRFRPIRTLCSAVENLRRWKVVGVIEKVQLIQDPATGGTFILKSLPKSHLESRERQTIIPHGVPFMAKLLHYYVSEDSIFLHLEHVQGGTLWSHLQSQPRLQQASSDGLRSLNSKPNSTLAGPGEEQRGQDLRLQAGERLLQSPSAASKTMGGGCLVKVEPQVYQVSAAPRARHTQPALAPPGQRQLHSGNTLHSSRKSYWCDSGGQESLRSISRVREGAGHGQYRERATAGQRGPPAHQTFQGDGQRSWHVNEELIQLWGAEMLLALEGLHQQGVLCRDLNPRNLLLDGAGHIRLTFFGQWTEVEPQCCSQALEDMYSAPEVGGIAELTEACDWWSFGSLLYELLTGTSLSQSHPSGIQPHTQLHLPEELSLPAASLLTELLQFDPKRRLGFGGGGVNKLKSHPFFSPVHWNKLVG
uniref:non-specific serine/threonine protein kinase n=1 Tax=Pelodiscus sinensis TaxID=13735 RepID=K7GGE1_PELSI